jgi:hypothetical protein
MWLLTAVRDQTSRPNSGMWKADWRMTVHFREISTRGATMNRLSVRGFGRRRRRLLRRRIHSRSLRQGVIRILVTQMALYPIRPQDRRTKTPAVHPCPGLRFLKKFLRARKVLGELCFLINRGFPASHQ